MAPYTPFCTICGAKITREASDDNDITQKWLSDISLIYISPDRTVQPNKLSLLLGDHARIPENEGEFPELLDESTGTYRILESALFKYEASYADSYCYPVHRACLGILEEVIHSCGIDAHPRELIGYLFLVFGEFPFDLCQVYWPSEYGGISEYQKLVRQAKCQVPPRFQFVETSPLDLEGMRKRVDEERENLKNKDAEGIENIPSTMPDFVPLPVEVVQHILGFLEWSDIRNLQRIPSKRTIDFPDIFWQELCEFQDEFGFLGYRQDDKSVTSWYEQCVLADRLMKRDLPEIKNRMRIWRLCIDIFSICTHSALEEAVGVEKAPDFFESLQPEDPRTLLHVQAADRRQLLTPTLFDGMRTRFSGTIDNIVTTGMYVSFKGTGGLRFVSGFKFLPSEKAVGHLSKFDNSFVSFKSNTPNEFLIMHVAANKYGIVDISVVSSRSPTPEPKWLGGCDLTGCAITRWTIRFGGPTTTFSKVIVNLNVLTMTSLQILRPSFMSSTTMTPEETFIQGHLWKPNIPVLNADSSLNQHLFYCTKQKMTGIGTLLSDDTYGQSEFNPLECIHGNETMTRLSFWSTGLYNDISAIEVYTKERGSTPYVVGKPMGAATDIFIDGGGGEYISGMKITVIKCSGHIHSLSIVTSYNRTFKISFARKEELEFERNETTRLVDLCPNDTDKVTGFYCRFSQHWAETALLDIGAITMKHDDPKRVSHQPPDIDSGPVNSQLIRPFDRTLHTPLRRQVAISNSWRFFSEASLKGCNKITAYFQIDPPFRLSGICIFYPDTEYPVLPTILGQIGRATTTETMTFDTSGGEVINEVSVFYKPLYGEEAFVVVGLGIGTSKIFNSNHNRRNELGDCKKEGVHEVEKLEIGESDSVQWEYIETSDYISLAT
ncbi:hypothetical protein TWF106_009335 [Orbilia oligospora]|uniref:F-box domain-containing protein n=1 Tax=Orbilia oligospora TaxID=2813651 RepID=A0A7C8UTC3_ORBOL|nr:hypothetical protein TWF106_009335 [Orbilia oligospora]